MPSFSFRSRWKQSILWFFFFFFSCWRERHFFFLFQEALTFIRGNKQQFWSSSFIYERQQMVISKTPFQPLLNRFRVCPKEIANVFRLITANPSNCHKEGDWRGFLWRHKLQVPCVTPRIVSQRQRLIHHRDKKTNVRHDTLSPSLWLHSIGIASAHPGGGGRSWRDDISACALRYPRWDFNSPASCYLMFPSPAIAKDQGKGKHISTIQCYGLGVNRSGWI